MLYEEAAQFLTLSKPGSLKGIVYNAYDAKNNKDKKLKADPRQVVLLVSSTHKYKAVLREVIKTSGLLKEEKRLKMDVAMMMVYDLLVSKSGRINCGKSLLKDAVLRHKTRLRAELVKYKLKHKIKDLSDVIETEEDETPIRWIRINPIQASIEQTEERLLKGKQVVDSIDEVKKGTIYRDIHVKNLFGIHPSESVTSTQMYKTGQIIIQDRASCFPAEILSPSPGDYLIDACSAPGNKTSHLAAHVNGTPHTVTAFERDVRRAEILRKMIKTAGADQCVDVQVQDFTASDPSEFRKVTGVLVDPSCSGSGIFGRAQFNEEQKSEESGQQDLYRLHKLAEFQYKIVKHALSFPKVKCVVYSTCSIHAEENERVVKRLLQDSDVKGRGWRLRPRARVLPNWHRRGWDTELPKDQAESCVRALPKEDGGIGFFAACFERV